MRIRRRLLVIGLVSGGLLILFIALGRTRPSKVLVNSCRGKVTYCDLRVGPGPARMFFVGGRPASRANYEGRWWLYQRLKWLPFVTPPDSAHLQGNASSSTAYLAFTAALVFPTNRVPVEVEVSMKDANGIQLSTSDGAGSASCDRGRYILNWFSLKGAELNLKLPISVTLSEEATGAKLADIKAVKW